MYFQESPSQKEFEEHLCGNICRCTGYRPILDAMKTFSACSKNVGDIEDLSDWVKVCPMETSACSATGNCKIIVQDGKSWFRPDNLESLTQYIENLSKENEYKIVAGNTAW